jgi:hypothetical protein
MFVDLIYSSECFKSKSGSEIESIRLLLLLTSKSQDPVVIAERAVSSGAVDLGFSQEELSSANNLSKLRRGLQLLTVVF